MSDNKSKLLTRTELLDAMVDIKKVMRTRYDGQYGIWINFCVDDIIKLLQQPQPEVPEDLIVDILEIAVDYISGIDKDGHDKIHKLLGDALSEVRQPRSDKKQVVDVCVNCEDAG